LESSLGSDLGQSYIELLFQVGIKKLDTLPSSEDWAQFLLLSPGEVHEKFAENMVHEKFAENMVRAMLSRL